MRDLIAVLFGQPFAIQPMSETYDVEGSPPS
jgi:hypothetical protein